MVLISSTETKLGKNILIRGNNLCNGLEVGKSLVVEFEELRGNQVAGTFLAKERMAEDKMRRERRDQIRQSQTCHGKKFGFYFKCMRSHWKVVSRSGM